MGDREPARKPAPRGEPRRTIGSWIRAAILVLSLLCLGWVLVPIRGHVRELAESLEGARLGGRIVAAAAGYAALSTLLALAWWWVTGIYGARPPVRAGYAVWARSQLAKYLPGNAFHYVSRQVLGRETGLSHPALVASGFLEMGSLVAAALLTATAALGILGAVAAKPLPGLALYSVVAMGVACLLAWPVCDALLRRFGRTAPWMEGLPHLSVLGTLRLLGPALGLHVLFFLGTGALLLALVAAAGGSLQEPFRVLGLYPLAWMAGTAAVGAPGGVGVREAVLTLGLEPTLGHGGAALVALALRLVTLGGDLLTALAGWWLSKPGGDRPH